MLKNRENCNRMKLITYLYKNLIKIADLGKEKYSRKLRMERNRRKFCE